jgi:hypothetical protein
MICGMGWGGCSVRCGSRKVDQKCVGRGWYETVFGRTEVVLWKGQLDEGAEEKSRGRRGVTIEYLKRGVEVQG